MDTKIISDSSKILNQLFSSFGHGLKPMMVKYFDTLDELLYELAEKAASDVKKKLYFESMQSIRVHKLNVLVSYLNTIQHVFKLFVNKDFDYFKDMYSYHKNKTITDTLNANDIEEKLAQNTLIHKFESEHQKQLDITAPYFSSIIKSNLEPQHNPISPFVLISAFAKSIRLLHLDQNIKMILYKHYELNIMAKIPTLYNDTIVYLSSKKAIELKNKTHTAPPVKTKNKNYTIAQSEIKTVLCDLQSKFVNSNNILPHSIKKALMAQLEHIQLSESRHIDNHDLYSIDFISMRFQLIEDDQNIHKSIKNIIFKLQIPYLIYLTDDDSFIEDKNHSAQLLLDIIHNSSIGWSEKRDHNQAFIKKLSNSVNIIIESKPLTESLFKVILKDYQGFIEHQKNEFAIEQERINKRELGKARIIDAMKTVDALIALKSENAALPTFINDILFGPWKNLLSLLLVRYSDTSEEYLKMVVFIDDLIGLLDTDQYDIIIESKIIKLSDVYKQGLELVAYSGDVLDGKIKKFNDNLMKYHNLGNYNSTLNINSESDVSNDISTKRYSKNLDGRNIINNKIFETKAPSLQGFNKKDSLLLATIPIGVWVEIPRHNKDPVKAQLSWINPKSGKYIFVNTRGLKVTDKSPDELLADLKNNRIIVSESLT